MTRQADSTPIWDEPPRGGSADTSLLALPGHEQLRSFLDGSSPLPPVARLTGRRLSEVEPGRVAYTLPVSDWLVGPKGTLHPAVLAFLGDAPLLAAVHSTLAPGTITTTAEVSMTFLGTASRGDELRAEGRMIHADTTTGLSEVVVTRRDGRLIGHGTSRVFIFPPIPQDDPPGSLEPRPEPEYDTPDPYLRAVEGGTLAPNAFDECSGLEILTGQLEGRFPRAPIDLLTGLRLTRAEQGRTEFRLTASGWCANELGTVYGGMLALLAGSAGSAAVQTIAPPGTRFTALDMKLNIIRPVAADGDELVATGTVVHGGRQLVIATTEIVDSGGKRIALATGTTMLGAAAAAQAEAQLAGITYQ